MMLLAAVMVLTYLAFVFFSENFNPFVKPKIQSFRPRWRYGRSMALAVLTGGLIVLALSNLLAISINPAIAIGLVVGVGLALCFSLGRIRQVLSK